MLARALGIATLLAALVASCSGGVDRASEVLGSAGASAGHSASVSPSPSEVGPSSSTSPMPSRPGGRPILVQSPFPGDEVISPVVVRGRAVSANGHVVVRVLDADGNELSAMNAPVLCGADCRGVFRVPMAFFAPARGSGTIQVYELGAEGEPLHLVEIPVTLVPGV